MDLLEVAESLQILLVDLLLLKQVCRIWLFIFDDLVARFLGTYQLDSQKGVILFVTAPNEVVVYAGNVALGQLLSLVPAVEFVPIEFDLQLAEVRLTYTHWTQEAYIGSSVPQATL